MFRGDRLEALMAARPISQSGLARRVGVSQATIWKLLNEPSQGSKHTHKIARELGTSAEYLMDETDNPMPRAVADERQGYRAPPPDAAPTAIEMERPAIQMIQMQVALPSEPALAQMFEGLLALVPEGATRAEAARILARRLPSGFAALEPLLPARGEAHAIADEEDIRFHATDRRGPARSSRM